MRLTVIPDDACVSIDGLAYLYLDLANCGVPENIHAFQWYETYGELEFKRTFQNGVFTHPVNEIISTLPDWALSAKEKWEEAKAADEAARLAAEEAATLAVGQTTSNTENINQTP
jgi:hypothetical protein